MGHSSSEPCTVVRFGDAFPQRKVRVNKREDDPFILFDGTAEFEVPPISDMAGGGIFLRRLS